MEENLGKRDKIIRVLITVIIIGLAHLNLTSSGFWKWIVYLIGDLMLITVVLSYDPIYKVLKINTSEE